MKVKKMFQFSKQRKKVKSEKLNTANLHIDLGQSLTSTNTSGYFFKYSLSPWAPCWVGTEVTRMSACSHGAISGFNMVPTLAGEENVQTRMVQ